MAALISSVMSTKDKVPFFVSRCEEMGIERAAAGRERLRPRLRRRRGRHPLRPRRGQERRLRGGREDPRGARAAAAPFTSIWDFCARVDCAHRQQEGDREPDQVRRARLDRRDAQGHAGRAAPRRRARARRRRRTRCRARDRSSTSTPAGGRPAPPAAVHYPPIPRTSSTASSCLRWRRRRSASSSPAIRSPTCATCCARAWTARWPSSRPSPTARG